MTNSGNGEGIYRDLLESLLKNTFTPIEWEGFTPYDQLPPRAQLKEHKAVHVDSTILQTYVGHHGDPPDVILTIRQEGNTCRCRKTNGRNRISSQRATSISSRGSATTSSLFKGTARAIPTK
jgi:hypothetical protein